MFHKAAYIQVCNKPAWPQGYLSSYTHFLEGFGHVQAGAVLSVRAEDLAVHAPPRFATSVLEGPLFMVGRSKHWHGLDARSRFFYYAYIHSHLAMFDRKQSGQ